MGESGESDLLKLGETGESSLLELGELGLELGEKRPPLTLLSSFFQRQESYLPRWLRERERRLRDIREGLNLKEEFRML